MTAFAGGSMISFAALVSGKGDSVTKSLTKYPLLKSGITLWDVWGFTKSNFSDGDLEKLLNGHFASGLRMGYRPKKDDKEYIAYPEEKDMMHGIVIVVSVEELSDNAEFMNMLSKFREVLFDNGYNPVVALTKVDLLDGALDEKPYLAYSSTPVQKAAKAFSEASGFPLSHIFPVKCYSNELDRDCLVESSALIPLSRALHAAK
jgi:hypothetical protein